jgi:acyl carrier protein
LTTTESIREAVAAVALAPLPDDDQASLFDLGIIDSFGLLNLVTRLEKTLGVTIPPGDIVPRRFATIAKIAGLVETRRK